LVKCVRHDVRSAKLRALADFEVRFRDGRSHVCALVPD
jgi:hypothetical protein